MKNYILVDFELLFNIEFGLIKYIQDDYDISGTENLSDKEIISLIRDRTEKNILSCFIKNEKSANKLLDDFMNEEYQNICDYSPQDRNIFEFLDNIKRFQMGEFQILCTNKIQEDICQKINCKTLLVNKNNIDWSILDKFNVFYMRYIDILFRKDFGLFGKVFYFPSTIYIYNLKEKIFVLQNLYGLSIKYLDLYN